MAIYSLIGLKISLQRTLLVALIAGLARELCECRTSKNSVIERFARESERNCKRKCQLISPKLFHKISVDDIQSGYVQCLKGCSQKKRKSIESRPAYIILGPEDPIPKDLIVPDKVIPEVPKEIRDLVDPALRTYGNCDIGQRTVDTKLKDPVLCEIASVSCLKERGTVLIKWNKPTVAKRITGYQINYSFNDGRSIFPVPKSMCFEVAENKTSFLIEKNSGFLGQREINVAVTALPLPLKCDFSLARYSLCADDVKLSRKRRSSDKNSTGPVITILGPNDPIPTGLIMPSAMPKLTREFFKTYSKGSNCEPPQLNSDKTIYAGKVKIRGVFCQKAGKFTKKGFNVNWDLPEDYLNVQFSGFQILYSVMKRNNHDPRLQFCHQVDKNIQSYTITNVESTDTVNVAVVPYPTFTKMNVYLEKFSPCVEAARNNNDKPSTSSRVIIICGVVAAVVVLALIMGAVYYLRRRKSFPGSEPQRSGKFYVSYYPDTKTYHQRLLHLVAQLRRVHSLNIIMDSICQTEVAEFGLPRWCQQQLTDAAKIIIVVSKEYLKVCQEWQLGKTGETGCTDANRICWELQYVVDHIFERRKNSRVFIILADVKASELPDFLRGRQIQAWPKNSKEVNSLACGICGVEEIVA